MGRNFLEEIRLHGGVLDEVAEDCDDSCRGGAAACNTGRKSVAVTCG